MELTPNLHAFLWASPRANNCNAYLIRSREKNILIDPGHAAYFDHVRRGLTELDMKVEDIDLVICTHAHPDHIEAVGLLDRSATLFGLHSDEWRLVTDMAPYLQSSLKVDLQEFAPDFFLEEGDLNVGDVSLQIFHTPGHSPGGITIFWPQAEALFSGDLIFRGGLGRTDLPGGNGTRLKQSIRRMAGLDGELLLSGHGDVVRGKAAVKANFEQVERMWFGYI